MSESSKEKPLNSPTSDLSDDEDLFASTSERKPMKTEQGMESEEIKVPTPPPRKQSQNSASQMTELPKSLESQMNIIDLNQSTDEEEEQKSLAVDDHENSKKMAKNDKDELNVSTPGMSRELFSHLPQGSLASSSNPINKVGMSSSSEPVTDMKTEPTEEIKPSINTASQITITVSDPQKIGEGMGSYMVYTVNTRTTLPYFRRQSLSVNRRFSDFLGLHSKLLMKHGHCGRIVPPPPAKSAVGTAKVKMAKDDSLHSMDFLAKRRAALERYLQRNAEHPVLCSDPDFREFLELDTELPRSTSTSALSGAGVKRLFTLVGDTVQKMTFRMEESDPWFESKQQQIEVLDCQLRKLHSSVDSLMHCRKELTTSLGLLAKSTALIGHDELNVSLSCALSHLAATHEKVEKIYETQANHEFLYLAELLRDYIAMIGAVKEAFHERVKCFQNLSGLEQSLNRKRESKAKMELSMKNERLSQIDEEIRELQEKMEKTKEDFEQISKTIKQEFERFDSNRIRDFKNNFLKYMESLLDTQENLIECWETFLPEAKSISA